jgi:segregation and condensation protein A
MRLEYLVRLDDYMGPLDRLLRLVEKQDIDAASMPVFAVIQQLVEFLEAASYADIDEGGRFLVMAATLLAIKAHLLLPEQDAGDGKEGSYWDEEDLMGGLAVTAGNEYLLIKEAARTLDGYARIWSQSYKRPVLREPEQPRGSGGSAPGAYPERQDFRDDVATLVAAFREILVRTVDEPVPYQVEEAVDFEQKMDTVFGQIVGKRGGLPFRQLFAGADRIEVIYRFLAVLELVFRGRLRLSQRQAASEIRLVTVK